MSILEPYAHIYIFIRARPTNRAYSSVLFEYTAKDYLAASTKRSQQTLVEHGNMYHPGGLPSYLDYDLILSL